MRICLLFFVAVLSSSVYGQSLTGAWEGNIADREQLWVNILQKEDSICGYTYDYIGSESYCIAHFKGVYDSLKQSWITTETGFLEMKGNHILMQLRFHAVFKGNKAVLKGWCHNLIGGQITNLSENNFSVKKISDSPPGLTAQMKIFMPHYLLPEKSIRGKSNGIESP